MRQYNKECTGITYRQLIRVLETMVAEGDRVYSDVVLIDGVPISHIVDGRNDRTVARGIAECGYVVKPLRIG